jgi:hypothetical protein
VSTANWSDWLHFPNPEKGEYLYAPIGPGVYRLRNIRTDKLVLFGESKNVAYRMTSILPGQFGAGTRRNQEKREYVWGNLADVHYCTLACLSEEEAKLEENILRKTRDNYLFPT